MIWRCSSAMALVAIVASPLMGQVPAEPPRTTISGLAFGDAYWMAASHDDEVENANGFWFRRIYLTFDHKMSESLDVRLRFETSSPGDFESASKLEPFVKDAYVRWKRGRQSVYLGISGTPIWGLVEKVWGYRSVEKTPLDLQRLGSSRDFGVALKGQFDGSGKVKYHAMLGTGSGTKGETNQGKKGQVSIGFYPTKHFTLEIYGDYEDRPDQTDRSTFQAFAVWQGERGRVGLQAARQRREVEDDTLYLDLMSVFGVLQTHPRAAFLARYDRMFDPNPDAGKISYLPMDPLAKSNLLLAGVDFQLHDQFHLIPNVEYVFYDDVDDGATPDDDLAIRLTFYATF